MIFHSVCPGKCPDCVHTGIDFDHQEEIASSQPCEETRAGRSSQRQAHKERSGISASEEVALLARFEHATFWSATKRSNPLSYRSKGEAILMHKGTAVKQLDPAPPQG